MSIVIIGTLDTKGEELSYARKVIEDQGVDVHFIDTGVMDDPAIEPETTAAEVAAAGGISLEQLREKGNRGEAMDVMGKGAAEIARGLHGDGTLQGVIGLGGSGNTSIATTAMRALPYGVPKLMVSTVASGDVRPYIEARDIMMMYSVADIEGLNQLTRQIISNAALAMVGMVANEPDIEVANKPTIGVTMFGVTTPCVQRAREYLEENGYEVLVFHATGTGGNAMEQLVEQGIIDGVLDVTTTEWADELVGGELTAGPDRLETPGRVGVPHVVSTGALDMVNFGPPESISDEFDGRQFHKHNPEMTLMRTTPDENAELGSIIAKKLNAGMGKRALFLPLKGVSMIDVKGEDFNDPEADQELFDALRKNISGDIELVEMDTDINEEEFALTMAEKLDEYMKTSS